MKKQETIPQPVNAGRQFPDMFPYASTLSFELLFDKLQSKAAEKGNLEAPLSEYVLKTAGSIPELRGNITDLSVVQQYRKEVDLLLSTVLPKSTMEGEIAGVAIPFQPVTIYGTPKFNALFNRDESGVWDLNKLHIDKGLREMVAFCGIAILKSYYNYPVLHPDIMKSKEPAVENGLTRYFQPEINAMFSRVIAKKEARPLSEIDLSPLKDDFFNMDFWLNNFPPDTFEFQGFIVYRISDITDREMVSQLEFTLLENGTTLSASNIADISDKLRIYFRVPDLRVGIAPMLNYHGQKTTCNRDNWFCFIPLDKSEMMFANFEGSIYQKAILSGGPYLVDDLAALPDATPVEKELMAQGIRNIIVVPIFQDQELIGAIEVGSPRAGELNFMTMLKLKQILPLMSVTFQRASKDLDMQVQATIKENFTSIHPSVEWKFARAALDMISNGNPSAQQKIAPIELKDVTPIYGQIDIRGSSDNRNEAIRLDLIDYLTSAKHILEDAHQSYPLNIVEEMIFRANKFIGKLESGMDSGDETGILEFMKQEVEPSLRLLSSRDEHLKTEVDQYFATLDPVHEIYHFRRHDFEQSLTMINELVSGMLEDEEERTQKLLPHYFEKYKTDGVEYNIYLGQSILQEGKFDPVFIRNFRLWQLITMVRIARETHLLLPRLPMPLETTQLILSYSNPFAIMFRMDEKRFDVAGAYNIRYEIVKKRIDKAHIKGTDERLTQPHKIAVIYTQDKEAKEYERYFEFMKAKGWIGNEVEYLDVEPLQGLQGLKALRVQVQYNSDEPELSDDEQELFRSVKDVMV